MTTPVDIPDPVVKKRISGAWYALTALPWLVAIAVLYVNVPRVIHGFTHMRLPTFEQGAHDVELRAGENTIYVEGVREGNDTYALASLDCTVSQLGQPIALEKTSGSETYTVGRFSGVAQFDVDIPSSGTYRVACHGSAPEALFAIGIGFPFLTVVWCLLAIILPLPLMGVIGFLVNRVRNGPRPNARIT